MGCSGVYLVEQREDTDAGILDGSPRDGGRETASGDASNGEAGDAGPEPSLVDLFDRTDGPPKNGWIERTEGVMAIRNGKLKVETAPPSYRRSILYRPDTENVADVEVSVDVVVPSFKAMFPQIHARVQTSTISQPDVLDSYLLYLEEDTNKVHLARNRGPNPVTIRKTIFLSSPLMAQQAFRLRLRVTGKEPVKVEGFVDRIVDETTSIPLGQEAFEDNDSERIQSAGSVGLSTFSYSDAGAGYTYDNFIRIAR
jgi:hypothetical protein